MKRKKRIKNAKKIILPGTFFIASFYLPILFLLGILFGYWTTNKFCKRYLDSGIMSPIYINFKGWEIHLHHWITGSLAIFIFFLLNGFYAIPQIVFGTLGGIVAHDFYTDKEWHRVIYKKENEPEL